MPFGTRLWGFGKFLVLVGALVGTFFLAAGVAMRVALRAREVEVPSLVGTSVNDASRALSDVGLTLRLDPNQRVHDTIPAGRITQQDPPPGVRARRQRTVRAWVSAGPRTTRLPALVGQTERTARLRLTQDGLTVASMSEFHSNDYAADAVVAQDPPPASRGGSVALLLNRGEQTAGVVAPDLIGMNGERAAEVLRAGGVRTAIVGTQPYPGVPPGTVVRQDPAGGFHVGPGDTLSLEVSR